MANFFIQAYTPICASTSEKDISYDEEGNAHVDVDQDPFKTIAEVNQHNYVTRSDFFDALIQEYVHFRFDYVNCGGDDNDHPASALKSSWLNGRPMNLARFLRFGSRKSIKEQVKEFRKQWRKEL